MIYDDVLPQLTISSNYNHVKNRKPKKTSNGSTPRHTDDELYDLVVKHLNGATLESVAKEVDMSRSYLSRVKLGHNRPKIHERLISEGLL